MSHQESITVCKPISKAAMNSGTSRINNRYFRGYLPVEVLKTDDKGMVTKSIRINQIYNMQWCVLKEGLSEQCRDESGRDMKDRLKWQFQLLRRLFTKIPVPSALQYFEHRGNAYLATGIVEGISLGRQVTTLCAGTCWKGLDAQRRFVIHEYILQILRIITVMHDSGLVHRDFSSENFMVTPNGEIYLIDLELCYDRISGYPSPPFTFGTPGYMSPEQCAAAIPAMAEDVYGLGALLIRMFTGLSPAKFDSRPTRLQQQLMYLLEDNPLAELISRCMHLQPECRPDVPAVRAYFNDLPPAPGYKSVNNQHHTVLTKKNLTAVIPDALQFLMTTPFLEGPSLSYLNSPSLRGGTAEVLTLFATASRAGYGSDAITSIVDLSFANWKNRLLQAEVSIPSTLFKGSAGWAMTHVELFTAGYIQSGYVQATPLQEYLLREPGEGLSLADGLAGNGLAMLKCLPYLQPGMAVRNLTSIADHILKRQQHDGSWLISPPGNELPALKLPGLYHGIAGITWFLLALCSVLDYPPAKKGAQRSLAYLAGTRSPAQDFLTWTINPHLKDVNPWLEDGFTGIAWVFIKASQFFKDDSYKQIAETSLLCHPDYIVSDYMDMDNGLAGLGQVYLEAAKAWGTGIWHDRAEWIAGLFASMVRTEGETCTWKSGRGIEVVPRISDHCGILHFLLHYCHPEKNSFLFDVTLNKS
jgi:serine/threonine protein kinase